MMKTPIPAAHYSPFCFQIFHLGVFLFLILPLYSQSFQDVTPISGIPLEFEVTNASLAVGDYNNDGSMDLYISGRDFQGKTVAYICQYDQGVFAPDSLASLALTPLANGYAEWGDDNNDGWLDLVVMGEDSTGTPRTELYLNDGAGGFQLANVMLRGLKYGEIRRGDFDNDGRMDFGITGEDSIRPWTQVYQQDRNANYPRPRSWNSLPNHASEGSVNWVDLSQDNYQEFMFCGEDQVSQIAFKRTESDRGRMTSTITYSYLTSLHPSVRNSRWNWADYDGDGDLDLLTSGLDNTGAPLTRIYQYELDSITPIWIFNPLPLGQIQVAGGGAAWADYNHDNQMDFLVSGKNALGELEAGVYTGIGGGGAFPFNLNVSSTSIIQGTDSGQVVWMDFNSDGNLDIVSMGADTLGEPKMKLYQNITSAPNITPTAPINLQYSIQADGSVLLSWDGAANQGNTYNVCIGTTPGGIDILSPLSDVSNGNRRVYRRGNAEINQSYLIAGLDTGTYYWSVQTIGPDFEGSVFASWDSFFYQPSGQVFPGDANYDQVANNLDLLPIGIHYLKTGPVRPGATLDWVGQTALNWFDTLSGGVDVKHVDTNGDGWILADDTLAIYQNYGLTHTANKQTSNGIPLSFSGIPASVGAGDTIRLDIELGTQDSVAMDLYGIGFSILYDTSLVQPNGVTVVFDSSWVGVKGTDLLTLSKDLFEMGQVDLALVRNDQVPRTGFGKIASIVIVMDDDISKRPQYLDLNFAQILAIDEEEQIIPVSGIGSMTEIDSTITSVDPWHTQDLRIFPNPIFLSQTRSLHIELPQNHLQSIEILALNGQKIWQTYVEAPLGRIQISLPPLSAGMYLLQVQSRKGVFRRKISILP